MANHGIPPAETRSACQPGSLHLRTKTLLWTATGITPPVFILKHLFLVAEEAPSFPGLSVLQLELWCVHGSNHGQREMTAAAFGEIGKGEETHSPCCHSWVITSGLYKPLAAVWKRPSNAPEYLALTGSGKMRMANSAGPGSDKICVCLNGSWVVLKDKHQRLKTPSAGCLVMMI